MLHSPAAWAQSASAPLDVNALVSDASRNGKTLSRRVFDYTWTSKNTTREANKRGEVTKESVRVYEVYPVPSRDHVVQKLISVNGAALSPKRAEKEQKRVMGELMLEVMMPLEVSLPEAEVVPQDDKGCPQFGIWTELEGFGGREISFGISDFLCAGEFSAPRTARLNERDVILLDFRPRADFRANTPAKAPVARMHGTVWIDAQDRVVMRIEAWLAQSSGAKPVSASAPARPAPALIFEDTRLPDGMWVRTLRYINTIQNPLAFNGVNVEWRQDFSEYRRYNTEFKEYKLEEPKAQP